MMLWFFTQSSRRRMNRPVAGRIQFAVPACPGGASPAVDSWNRRRAVRMMNWSPFGPGASDPVRERIPRAPLDLSAVCPVGGAEAGFVGEGFDV